MRRAIINAEENFAINIGVLAVQHLDLQILATEEYIVIRPEFLAILQHT